MVRVAITGGPKTGKTTMASTMSGTIRHTDDLIGLGWSEASLACSRWFDEPGAWVVEGVMVPRALRKWLNRNRHGKPCDEVIFMTQPKAPTRPSHKNMSAGIDSVWLEIEGELARRGVKIIYK